MVVMSAGRVATSDLDDIHSSVRAGSGSNERRGRVTQDVCGRHIATFSNEREVLELGRGRELSFRVLACFPETTKWFYTHQVREGSVFLFF